MHQAGRKGRTMGKGGRNKKTKKGGARQNTPTSDFTRYSTGESTMTGQDLSQLTQLQDPHIYRSKPIPDATYGGSPGHRGWTKLHKTGNTTTRMEKLPHFIVTHTASRRSAQHYPNSRHDTVIYPSGGITRSSIIHSM